MSIERPIPRNVRSSGALVVANSDNGVAIFSGYDLEPGDVRSARVLIVNRGSVAGRFKVVETDASNDFAAGDLNLVIDDITGHHPVAVFVGEIGGLPPGGIDLGRFEPGQSRRFRFLVMLNLNAAGAGPGKGAGAAYEWDLAPDGEATAISCASFREER